MRLDALNQAGCKRIFTDKLSGAEVERPGLKEALSHLREDDTLVVWKLDRLGRSVKGLVDLVNELEARKVHFQSITDGVDTKTPAGRFFFHVMASLAQMERELIPGAHPCGLEAARRLGRVGGRKRTFKGSKFYGNTAFFRLQQRLESEVLQFYRHRQEPVPGTGRVKHRRLFRRPRTTNERRADFRNGATKEILESCGFADRMRLTERPLAYGGRTRCLRQNVALYVRAYFERVSHDDRRRSPWSIRQILLGVELHAQW